MKKKAALILASLMAVMLIPSAALASPSSPNPFSYSIDVAKEGADAWKVDIRLSGREKSHTATDIVYVVESSSAMDECIGTTGQSRLAFVQMQLKGLTQEIVQNDYLDSRIAVVSYAAEAKVEAGFSNSISSVSAGLDRMSASGTANLSKGLAKAGELLEGSDADFKLVIIVASSGMGMTFFSVQSEATKLANSGAILYGVGIQAAQDTATLLKFLADACELDFVNIESLADITEFTRIKGQILVSIVARLLEEGAFYMELPMSEFFSLQPAGIIESQGKTVVKNSNTLGWVIGDLNGSATLSFIVKLNPSANPSASEDLFSSNAYIMYQDSEGNKEKDAIQSPIIDLASAPAGPNHAGTKNTEPKNASTKSTGSKNTEQKNTPAKNTGKNIEPKVPDSKNSGSKNTGTKNTGIKNTEQKNTPVKNTGKNTQPKVPDSKNSGSKNTGKIDTGKKNTDSKKTGSISVYQIFTNSPISKNTTPKKALACQIASANYMLEVNADSSLKVPGKYRVTAPKVNGYKAKAVAYGYSENQMLEKPFVSGNTVDIELTESHKKAYVAIYYEKIDGHSHNEGIGGGSNPDTDDPSMLPVWMMSSATSLLSVFIGIKSMKKRRSI